MKIVVDTNVLISGVFFGGYPQKILNAIVRKKVSACATEDIIHEYFRVIDEMVRKKQGRLNNDILLPLILEMNLIPSVSQISICRDPDDDKFIACAKDGKALYIVSGDKDLLTLQSYGDIGIITAKEFCEQYLKD